MDRSVSTSFFLHLCLIVIFSQGAILLFTVMLQRIKASFHFNLLYSIYSFMYCINILTAFIVFVPEILSFKFLHCNVSPSICQVITSKQETVSNRQYWCTTGLCPVPTAFHTRQQLHFQASFF